MPDIAVLSQHKLRKLYHKDKMSLREIAEMYDVSRTTIQNRMEKWDIPRRSHSYKREDDEEFNGIIEQKEDVWQLSEQGKRAKSIASKMHNTTHGLYASIPIICKSKECPYSDSCYLYNMGEEPYAEPCPIEVSTVEDLAQRYMEELEINPNDMVDISMVRDVIDMDISIMRCNKKLAADADIVQEVVAGVSEHGDEFTQPQIHKAYDLQLRLMRQRSQILDKLHATRKEKAKDDRSSSIDFTDYIKQLKNRADDYDDVKIVDVVDEDEEEIEVIEE